LQLANNTRAVADSPDLRLQVEELQHTVLALRETLERNQSQAFAREQAMLANTEAEKVQLRATVEELRLQLEQREVAHIATQQQLKAEASEEIRQLQLTVVAQRQQLEQLSAAVQA
jgi:hypothetical protein